MTYHHHITGALAEARVADMGRTAARNGPTPSAGRRPRRNLPVALLIAAGALSSSGAVAHPARDAGTSASGHAVVARDRQSHATSGMITFTNPLGRSRGVGAGAGLL